MKKVAVLGGKGMLGTDVVPCLTAAGYEVGVFDLPEFDITSDEQLEEVVSTHEIIVNCSAYTAVDQAEENTEECWQVNADAVLSLGALAEQLDRYVVHISTDFVFGDTTEKLLRETDAASPLNIYGRTKYAGEENLTKSGCRHSVLRVQWTYGGQGNHFIKKIIDRARQLDSIKVVDDQIGSPTWTYDVSKAIEFLVRTETEGIFHYAADGFASRCEVAEFIIAELGLGKPVVPCSTQDFPTPAKRPLNSRFDCTAIDEASGLKRPHWRDSLGQYLKQIQSR